MNFRELLSDALASLLANSGRSALTMLGIAIGVGAVIAMVSLGQASSSAVTSSIQGLGSNLLIVSPSAPVHGGVRLAQGSTSELTVADADALAALPQLSAVAPVMSHQAQVTYLGQNDATTIQGTTPEAISVNNLTLSAGRFFTSSEVQTGADVAVLGQSVVQSLFGSTLAVPLGATVDINEIPFRVIGILAAQGQSGFINQDDRIIVPITTAQQQLFGDQNLQAIYASARTPGLMTQAQSAMTAVLNAEQNLPPGSTPTFNINSQTQVLNAAQSVSSVLTLLLAGIAGISLLVGGIGIMNIMLVTVYERVREIGIRKALGARRRDVSAQFLTESVVLSVFGGLAGLIIGGAGTLLIGHLMNLQANVGFGAAALAVAFSLAIGIFFGVMPARRAALLDPIEALRRD